MKTKRLSCIIMLKKKLFICENSLRQKKTKIKKLIWFSPFSSLSTLINNTFICSWIRQLFRLIAIRHSRRRNVSSIFHNGENTTKIIDHNLKNSFEWNKTNSYNIKFFVEIASRFINSKWNYSSFSFEVFKFAVRFM